MNAIDTNVIAYLFDPTARVKQARAQQLLDWDSLLIAACQDDT